MEEQRVTMYEEDMCCYDPNTQGEITVENSFSQAVQPPPQQTLVGGSTSNSSLEVEEISEFHLSPQDYHHHHHHQASLQYHNMNTPLPPCDQFNNNNIDSIQQQQQQQSNWDNGYQDLINMVPTTTTTPDLLSLLHLPRYSLPHHHHHPMFPNLDTIMSSGSGSVMYDPLFHLNFPQRNNSSLLLGVEDHLQMDANGNGGGTNNSNNNMMYYENNNDGFDNGILEFNNNGVITRRKGGRGGSGKSITFPTERERRVHFTGRFFDLKKLIPNPTKTDRASIVGEAIDYIKELLRTIEEFKMLVEKKRFGKVRSKKRAKGEENQEEDTVSYNRQHHESEVDQSCFNKKNNNSSLRCSWLKRKSKVTEVDVRIIDDEVTIKVVQKKKINCLLLTAKVLDQLQLDLHHVAGGQIGEHYSFLFNTKICEGSCVHASGIADTVMEVVEKHYMEASVPTNGY